jgi:poly(A) polymerase
VKKKPKVQKLQTGSKRIPSSKVSTGLTESRSKWIRIDRPFTLPPYVKQALDRLDDAGHVAYVVGGSVRDFLLGKETKDHDLATSAHPDELCQLFPNAITVGKAFGVIKVPVSGSVAHLEIATFREDVEYNDHRHPKKVRFTDAVEDAKRRDFTINALYYDPKTARILDPTNGMKDLEQGVVRAIGDPDERFREDALRLLRAVRFTTRFSFKLDSKTTDAVKERAKLLPKVSSERIRDELTAMWTGRSSANSLMLLSQLGLLNQVLPEVDQIRLKDPVIWAHSVKVLSSLEKQNPVRSLSLVWAALLIDVGRFSEKLDAPELAVEIANRMKMSRAEINEIELLLANHLKFREVFQMREATLQRFLREPYFDDLLALHRADASATDGNLAYYEFCVSRLKTIRAEVGSEAPKLVDGTDLIQLGLKPGPDFSNILRVIEDLSLEHKLKSKEEALEYVVKNFVK